MGKALEVRIEKIASLIKQRDLARLARLAHHLIPVPRVRGIEKIDVQDRETIHVLVRPIKREITNGVELAALVMGKRSHQSV
jgi:hypothetical protein